MRHDMPRMCFDRVCLERWHRIAIYAVTALTTVSGLAWLWLHYFVTTPGRPSRAPHPLEPLSLKIHGAAAMLMLLCLGTLLLPHMLGAWRLGRNRYPGGLLAMVNLLLILTGYALYYVSTEENHAFISAVHWITGLLLPVVMVLHIVTGRRGGPRG